MIVVMIESTGMFPAPGETDVGRQDRGQPDIARGLRADGVGNIIGGIFNAFPYTSFSQNVGLVGVTGVRSRFVAAAGGAILIVLSLIPKLAALVAHGFRRRRYGCSIVAGRHGSGRQASAFWGLSTSATTAIICSSWRSPSGWPRCPWSRRHSSTISIRR